MSPNHIILRPEHAALIRHAARAAFPRECCGLLLGDGADTVQVARILATANIAADPLRHFAIDPQILFDHHRPSREIRSRKINMRIVGHYHSHPNGRRNPSAEDLAMAHDRDAVWIIAAVAGDEVSLCAYVPADRSFIEIPIET
jgi:proteasome lid subunit RPN8/RPN11